MKILCIMQNAYTGRAYGRPVLMPLSFKINPLNHSGKKLHRVLHNFDYYVANACPLALEKAEHKGKTDLPRLVLAVKERVYDIYISFGNQSNDACTAIISQFNGKPLIYFPHPASRTLTNDLLFKLKEFIESGNFDIDSIHRFVQFKGGNNLENIKRLC